MDSGPLIADGGEWFCGVEKMITPPTVLRCMLRPSYTQLEIPMFALYRSKELSPQGLSTFDRDIYAGPFSPEDHTMIQVRRSRDAFQFATARAAYEFGAECSLPNWRVGRVNGA